VFEVEQQSFYITFKAHTPRVKRIKHLKIAEKDYLISCSTDGTICTWDIDEILANIGTIAETKALEEDLKPLYSLYSYQRIITLDAHFSNQIFDGAQQPGALGVAQEAKEEVEGEEGQAPKQALQQAKKNNKNKNKKNKKANENNNAPEKQGKKIKKVQFAEPEEKKSKKPVQADKKKTFDKSKVVKSQQKYQQKADQKKTFGKNGKQGGKHSNKDLNGKNKKKFGQKLEVEYDD